MSDLERLGVVEWLDGWLDAALVPMLVVAWLACGVAWLYGHVRRRRVLSDPPARVDGAPQGAPTGAPLPPGKDTAP
jgi:hypothetical protein